MSQSQTSKQIQAQSSLKEIISTPYVKVISIIKDAKKYITMMSKSQSKLIRELDWAIKVITSHSLYTYEISDNSLISKYKKENADFKQFVDFVSTYNDKVIEVNKTSDLVLSKSAQMQNEINTSLLRMPSLAIKKEFPVKYRKCKSKMKSSNFNIRVGTSPGLNANPFANQNLMKLSVNSLKFIVRNGNNSSFYSNTNPNVNNSISKGTSNKNNVSSLSKSPVPTSGHYSKSYLSFSNKPQQSNFCSPGSNNSNTNNVHSHKRFHTPNSNENASSSNTKNPFLSIENILVKHNFDIKRILTKEFNIFELKNIIGHQNVLPLVGKTILESFGINDKMINTSKLDSFLTTVTNSYYTTTLYHNSIHGADVTQTITLFFLNSNAEAVCATNVLDILSILTASLGHDIGHPGFTNSFQINAKSEIALMYNDISCLENYHASCLFKLERLPENSIFDRLSSVDYKTLRKRMIGMILATDMANHGKVMSVVKGLVNSQNLNGASANNQINLLTDNPKTKFEEQQAILDYFIHSADLAHNTKLFHISLQWVELLSNEFWIQGDKEKSMNLPVSFLCERVDADVPSSQVGFIKGFIIPTFDVLVQVFPTLSYTVENAKDNLVQWEQLVSENRKKGWTHRGESSSCGDGSGSINDNVNSNQNNYVTGGTGVNSNNKKAISANWGKPKLLNVHNKPCNGSNNNNNSNFNTNND